MSDQIHADHTFAVADITPNGFSVVPPGLKSHLCLTGVLLSQVLFVVAFRYFVLFESTFRTIDGLFVRQNLRFILVLVLKNIQIDVSFSKEKIANVQPSHCHRAER